MTEGNGTLYGSCTTTTALYYYYYYCTWRRLAYTAVDESMCPGGTSPRDLRFTLLDKSVASHSRIR